MFKPVSRLRHKSIHKLIKMCQEKEQAGWECIKPIQKSDSYFKHFSKDSYNRYEYQNTDVNNYYEAVYQKKVM